MTGDEHALVTVHFTARLLAIGMARVSHTEVGAVPDVGSAGGGRHWVSWFCIEVLQEEAILTWGLRV